MHYNAKQQKTATAKNKEDIFVKFVFVFVVFVIT